MTTCPRSSAETARGTFVCGDGVGVGAAIACGGGGVGFSDGTRNSSGVGMGVFSWFGVSLVSKGVLSLLFYVFLGVEGGCWFLLFIFFMIDCIVRILSDF